MPRRRSGTVVSRRNRPPWKPARGETIWGIPEPLAFGIVMAVVVLLLVIVFL